MEMSKPPAEKLVRLHLLLPFCKSSPTRPADFPGSTDGLMCVNYCRNMFCQKCGENVRPELLSLGDCNTLHPLHICESKRASRWVQLSTSMIWIDGV
jgi:hypothetical protein